MSDMIAANLSTRFTFVRDFARSDLFDRTFREGMALVEETATYLDGEGRRDSRLLSREDALVYAGESMRLTTRLMQIASWLLVQRAVREGDMEAADACDEKYRLMPASGDSQANAAMPDGLLDLLDRANRLHDRIAHLDRRMFGEDEIEENSVNPVQAHLQRIQGAFGA